MVYGDVERFPEGSNHSFELIFPGIFGSKASSCILQWQASPRTATSSTFASLLCDSALDAQQPTEASKEIRALRGR